MTTESLTICQVVPSLCPDYGGPPVVAMQLAATQASFGHEVHMISHEQTEHGSKVDTFLETIPHVEQVNFHRVLTQSRRESLLGGELKKEIARLAARADIFHLHGVWEPTLVASASIARQYSCPYVITPHGMLDPYCMRQKRIKKRIMLSLVYRNIINRASALHLLNEDERRLIQPLRLTAPQVTIPNGVHLNEIDPLPSLGTFRKRYPELGNREYFLFLSRLHPKKGLDILIRAFADYLDQQGTHDLVIAGPDGGVQANVEQQIRQYGLGQRVHLVGPQYGTNKYAALRDAYAFVLTSHQEGFSIAITEAIACRLPVLISENCHFPEIEAANAGYVVELQPTAITDALHDLAGDAAQASAMGEAGRELVEEKFTWSTICDQLISLYRKTSGGSLAQ